jgi:hypothetical protein
MELVFRNHLNAMNEHSEPVLLYSFTEAKVQDEKDFVMKVAWFDPNGNVAFVTKKSITNTSVRKETIVPDFKRPMMNGIWTAIVINQQNHEFLVKIPFLVFPSNKNYVNSETVSYQVDPEEVHILTKIFQESNQNEQDKKLLKLNHVRVHSDDVQLVDNEAMTSWLKQLVNEFYKLVSVCQYDTEESYLDHHKQMLDLDIPHCKETIWSSLSPDPKSTISKFDNKLLKLV